MHNALLLIILALFSAASPNASAQIKAQDYDTPSYIQFTLPRYEVSETETNAVVTIVRSGDFRKVASIDYSTVEGTAEDNIDFKPSGGTIVFAAGQNFRTITIPVMRSAEPVVKKFQVQMMEADSNTIVTTPSAEIEIKPTPPALSIAAKAGGLLLSWPDAGAPFVLEAQVDGAWSAVQTPPALANGTWSVTVDASAPVVLFRLRLDAQPQ
jgi:hypothetical protein